MLRPTHMQSPQSLSSRRGFALLITIQLIALLLILVIGMASFVRVEVQIAANSQQLEIARQNAIFALNLALGELQRTAGPDQRTTAPAARLDTNPATPPIEGVLSPNWTGVWGRTTPSATNFNAPSTISQPRLLQWLVSGNTTTSPLIASVASADFGRITSPTVDATPAFQPTQAITGLDSSTTALSSLHSTAGTRINNQPAALLVGPKTTDFSSTSAAQANAVVAPLVPITAPAGSVPGLDPAATPTVGRFAWWVGDEAVKARINLVDEYNAATVGSLQDRLRAQSAQRVGIELVDDDTDPLNASLMPSVYPANGADLRKVLELNQFPFSSADPDAQSTLYGVRKLRFHDLTTTSTGVLADTLRGGLRKDLTAAFAGPALPVALNGVPVFTAADAGAAAGKPDGPTWDSIRDYYRLNPSGSATFPVQTSTPTTAGVAPIMVGAQIAVSAGVAPVGGVPRIHYHIVPSVALWNPYNVTLAASVYSFNVTPGSGCFLVLQVNQGGTLTPANTNAASTDGFIIFRPGGGTAAILTFTLQSRALAPGETVVYSLAANQSLSSNRTPGVGFTLTPDVITPYFAATYIDPKVTVPAGTLTNLRLTVYGNGGLGVDPSGSAVGLIALGMRKDSSAGSVLGRSQGLRGRVQIASTFTLPDHGGSVSGAPQFGWKYALRMGDQSGTTIIRSRWLADLNPRSPRSSTSPSDITVSGDWQNNPSFHSWIPSVVNPFAFGLAPVASGWRVNDVAPQNAWLFTIPTTSDDFAARITSLGELHSAPWYRNDPNNPLGGSDTTSNYQPAFPLGNSLAPARISAATISRTYTPTQKGSDQDTVYDHSLLLNHALWDRYFFSTVSATTPPAFPLPNGRFSAYSADGTPPATADLRDYDRAASRLLVKGAFNINSTSVDAWAALLGSLRDVPIAGATPVAGQRTPYTRSATPATAVFNPSTDDASSITAVGGFRALTDAQIRDLSEKIVVQVKTRGPFLSLAQLINRSLVTGDDRGLKGALQAAIDATTLNDRLRVPTGIVQLPSSAPAIPYKDLPTGFSAADTKFFLSQAGGINDRQFGFGDTGADTTAHSSPGFFTQADLLQSLATTLQARSDTFRIRTFGEVVNPVTQTTTGRAWCEAIVQRLPDYLNPSADAAETSPPIDATNQIFGRRFQVVSFRWLSPEDI